LPTCRFLRKLIVRSTRSALTYRRSPPLLDTRHTHTVRIHTPPVLSGRIVAIEIAPQNVKVDYGFPKLWEIHDPPNQLNRERAGMYSVYRTCGRPPYMSEYARLLQLKLRSRLREAHRSHGPEYPQHTEDLLCRPVRYAI
jgi:hypothetical protein